MPYGIVVTPPEAELIRSIWGADGVDMIHVQRNIAWFDPKRGKTIVSAILDHKLDETQDEDGKRRLLNRIAALCGKTLLEPTREPIAKESETVHIETEAETVTTETQTDIDNGAPPPS